MLNAYVHSVIDYGLDIWAIHSIQQLNQIQEKVDRFIVSFFLPGLIRRSKAGYDTVKRNVCIHKLWTKCNFTSIHERMDFVMLKNLYKDFIANKLSFTARSESKSMPLLETHSFKSQLFKNSVLYKGALLWNSLPKSWVLKEVGYNKFKEKVLEWIISKRDNVYVYN